MQNERRSLSMALCYRIVNLLDAQHASRCGMKKMERHTARRNVRRIALVTCAPRYCTSDDTIILLLETRKVMTNANMKREVTTKYSLPFTTRILVLTNVAQRYDTPIDQLVVSLDGI